MYCIYQRLWNQAIQFLQVWSYHSYEYGWGCRQQGLCATHQTLLEQVEWKRLCQNYFGPWPTTGAANLRKQSTARRAHPLGAVNGTRLRLWGAGPGDKRRHLCPGQYYPGPGCISTEVHSHGKASTAHPGHTPSSLLIFPVLSGVPRPPFPCRLSPRIFYHIHLPHLLPSFPVPGASTSPHHLGPASTTTPSPLGLVIPTPTSVPAINKPGKSHRITLCHLESTFSRKTLPSLSSCFTSPAQRVQPDKGTVPSPQLHESSAAGADSINSCK